MDPTPTSDVLGLDKRQRLLLAGLVAVPVYVLPVGLWGLRAMRPRLLRNALSGAITLGMLSLLGMSVRGLARVKTLQASDTNRWKLPNFRWLMPEEFAASAASGH
ncbi:MAG TPA: hypothetical protein VF794_29725 [Archangium sp.]|jgi:hypothetical protein|uniref:hypothetical protein n=1 Tax=Archangium sp. TaxID=1872627 RepID=UPI002ED869F5